MFVKLIFNMIFVYIIFRNQIEVNAALNLNGVYQNARNSFSKVKETVQEKLKSPNTSPRGTPTTSPMNSDEKKIIADEQSDQVVIDEIIPKLNNKFDRFYDLKDQDVSMMDNDTKEVMKILETTPNSLKTFMVVAPEASQKTFCKYLIQQKYYKNMKLAFENMQPVKTVRDQQVKLTDKLNLPFHNKRHSLVKCPAYVDTWPLVEDPVYVLGTRTNDVMTLRRDPQTNVISIYDCYFGNVAFDYIKNNPATRAFMNVSGLIETLANSLVVDCDVPN